MAGIGIESFGNPKFQNLIRDVLFDFVVIYYHGEVSENERNKTHIFSCHGMAGIAAANRVDFSALCSTRCALNRATRPPQGARRGGVKSKYGGPAAGGGRRKKMGPGRVSGFFKLDNLKGYKTFTNEIFVGKGYS